MKYKSAKQTARGKGKWQGMNWLRQDKRLAIFLRDGLACVWCGDSAENGAKLTADHVVPAALGGRNVETNVVTCCSRCNSSKGKRTAAAFAKSVAGYLNHGVTAKEILGHVRACVARELMPYRAEAKTLIARRGSAARVLASIK